MTIRHLPIDDPDADAVMAKWTPSDRLNAATDAILFGNIYVGSEGEYIPAAEIHQSTD
jgi:hypothetical protein